MKLGKSLRRADFLNQIFKKFNKETIKIRKELSMTPTATIFGLESKHKDELKSSCQDVKVNQARKKDQNENHWIHAK